MLSFVYCVMAGAMQIAGVALLMVAVAVAVVMLVLAAHTCSC